MKKFVFLLLFVLTTQLAVQAQNQIEGGLRFGGGFNNNVAIDFTIPIAAKPRLHPTLYIDNGGVAIGSYFDWMFEIKDAHNWRLYPGVGPELYLYDGADLGVAGNFGIEYLFDIPLTVGFDWRPSIILTRNGNFSAENWGISARYRFN